MTDKYDPKKLGEVVHDLYNVITGHHPDANMISRLDSGVRAVINLYETDPKLFYASLLAVAPLVDGYIEKNLGLGNGKYDSKKIMKDIADLFKTN